MELVTDLRSICWHTHNCEVPGDCYGPTNLTSVACFLFFSPAMSNYIFTMLVFTFHEWISCLYQWWFFVFAIGDDFRMTSIWYQLWSSKLENIKLPIIINRFTKKNLKWRKAVPIRFFTCMYILIKSKCLKSNIVYCYALCRAILAVIDHLRYECFCATANKTKVWLM